MDSLETCVQLLLSGTLLILAITGSVITPGIITWCMHKKGPVFVATFKPLAIVFAAFTSSIFLGETLYVGSVIGAIIIVIGFYSVMWGKSKDEAIDCVHDCDSSETFRRGKPLLDKEQK